MLLPPLPSRLSFHLSINVIWASEEALLTGRGNQVKQIFLSIGLLSSDFVPYLVAAFAHTSNLVRLLFGMQLYCIHSDCASTGDLSPLYRKTNEHSRLALDIGHAGEKREVPTTIVLDKSTISPLYEAGKLVLHKEFSISQVYLTVIGPAAIPYSLQRLYTQVHLKPDFMGVRCQLER